MVRAAVDYFGRLDILYNNAAVQMSGRLVDCTEDDWDVTIATNLSAIFWACRAALPHMLGRDGGSIINTASTLGLIGSEGYAAYGAAKAGLVALDAPDRGRLRADGAGQRDRAGIHRHAAVPQGDRRARRSRRVPAHAHGERPRAAARHRGRCRGDRALPRERPRRRTRPARSSRATAASPRCDSAGRHERQARGAGRRRHRRRVGTG